MNEAENGIPLLQTKVKKQDQFLDFPGKKFNSLTVKAKSGKNRFGQTLWMCVCDCGKITTVTSANLKRGSKKSCGCLKHVAPSLRLNSHGMRGHALYVTWKNLRVRCYAKKSFAYPDYGGRGITICERWRTSFPNFLADMGEKPSPAHSLDRIKNDGNYEPGNCRWATAKEQGSNKRNNIVITISGISKIAAEWSAESGLNADCIIARFQRGWPADRLLSPPRVTKTKARE